MARPQALLFDLNETLLDLTGLLTVLVDALGGGERLAEWFFRLLHGSLVANATDTLILPIPTRRPRDVRLQQQIGLEYAHGRGDQMRKVLVQLRKLSLPRSSATAMPKSSSARPIIPGGEREGTGEACGRTSQLPL